MKNLSEHLDGYGMPFVEGYKPIREQKESFLPERLVMIDLEMTGVCPDRDEIIQIAMTKLKLDHLQYIEDGESLEIFPHTNAEPSNDFHREFLVDIFGKANESTTDIADCGPIINDWLKDYRGAMPTGDCVSTDLSFLFANGIIDRGDIVDGEHISGTFNYETFEMHSLKCAARQRIGKKESLNLDAGIHDASVDVANQIKELNYYLEVLLLP